MQLRSWRGGPDLPLSPTHSGRELDLLREAVESNWVAPLGPQVDAFEQEVAEVVGVPHALALSSGSAALHLALIVLGIGPRRRGRVLLVHVLLQRERDRLHRGGSRSSSTATRTRGRSTPSCSSSALDERPGIRAVVAVDLYGQCCDYDALEAVCAQRGIPIVQDAAESLGSFYGDAPAGGQGALAAFSFNGNKVITTSGGGMLVSRDPDWIAHARKLSTQAREPEPHYEHTEIGFNYRLSNLLAAVGRAQLERAAGAGGRAPPDQRPLPRAARGRARHLVHARGAVRARQLLADVHRRRSRGGGTDRERIRLALEAEDIESRPLWKPMHLQPVFRDAPAVGGDVSAGLFDRGLCLPSGSALAEADQERVVEILLSSRTGTKSSQSA